MKLRTLRRRHQRRMPRRPAWPIARLEAVPRLNLRELVEWLGPREAFHADGSVRNTALMSGMIIRRAVSWGDDAADAFGYLAAAVGKISPPSPPAETPR